MPPNHETAILLPTQSTTAVAVPNHRGYRSLCLGVGLALFGLAFLFVASLSDARPAYTSASASLLSMTRPVMRGPSASFGRLTPRTKPPPQALTRQLPSYRPTGTRYTLPRTRTVVRDSKSDTGVVSKIKGAFTGINVGIKDAFSGWVVDQGKPTLQVPLRFVNMYRAGGRGDYVMLNVQIGKENFDFMLDTGLTGNLITQETCSKLGVDATNGWEVEGLGGGGNLKTTVVKLQDVNIAGQLKIPFFNAAVVDFPQRSQGIDGMIGMDTFRQFDIDVDRESGLLSFYVAGRGVLNAYQQNAVLLQSTLLPVVDLLGLRVQSKLVYANVDTIKQNIQILKENANTMQQELAVLAEKNADQTAVQEELSIINHDLRVMHRQLQGLDIETPFLGIVDSGATHTIMNWEAAAALGLQRDDPRLEGARTITAMGVDGNEFLMPVVPMSFRLLPFDWTSQPGPTGSPEKGWRFTNMKIKNPSATPYVDFVEIEAAIGNANFKELLNLTATGRDDLRSYEGPVVLVGQDILTQRRMWFSGALQRIAFGAKS